jgi:hypothetical protein
MRKKVWLVTTFVMLCSQSVSAIAAERCDNLSGSYNCPGCFIAGLGGNNNYQISKGAGTTTMAPINTDTSTWDVFAGPGWSQLRVTASRDCRVLQFTNGSIWVRQ